MRQFISKIFLIFIFISIVSCGYKILDTGETENFNIKELKTTGDVRVNFKIKNSLNINSSENKTHNLLMELYTEKKKEIKEKNIKNQITKYEITLNSYVKVNFLEKDKKVEFNIVSSGSYQVADQYSTTLKNEKRLTDDLTNDISDKIKKQINLKLNDF